MLVALALVPECATAAQLTLTWSDNASNETSYRIERKIGSGSYSEIAVLPVDTETYTDINLAGSTNYCYRVRALNAAGSSGYSNEACRTTSISTLAITVTKSGTGSGTVASAPTGINCGSDCTEDFRGRRRRDTLRHTSIRLSLRWLERWRMHRHGAVHAHRKLGPLGQRHVHEHIG